MGNLRTYWPVAFKNESRTLTWHAIKMVKGTITQKRNYTINEADIASLTCHTSTVYVCYFIVSYILSKPSMNHAMSSHNLQISVFNGEISMQS